MKKLLKMFLVAIMCVVFALPTVGCKAKTTSNDPQTLDIYLLYKGFQDEWLTSVFDDFKAESWVKDKYPNLKIQYTFNQDDGFASQKLPGGISINGYDLMFGVNLDGFAGSSSVADLTDIVYKKTVPGESVTVESKIPQEYKNMFAHEGDGESRYYSMCYVEGFWSMLYNKDLLDGFMGENVIPVTTNEFLAVCQQIKTTGYDFVDPKNDKTEKVYTPIMLAHNGYWDTSFDSWWLMYEGLQGYSDFFNGVYDEELSPQVMRQKGRLRSLQVIEDIFTSGYGYEKASEKDYIFAQTNFLSGNGVFHYNGSYFVTEMADAIKALEDLDIHPDIRYMKMPVPSAIVERCDFYTSVETDGEDVTDYEDLDATKKANYDQILAAIVRDIDNNLTYAQSKGATNGAAKLYNVSANDWAIIAESRQLSSMFSGGTQTVVIPKYSPAKELASDFLAYMYTDKMIKNFVMSSGHTIPSNIDWSEDSEVYASLHPINVSKFDILKGSSNYKYIKTPPKTSYVLGKAGLGSRSAFTGRLEVQFMLPISERQYTAEDIYQMDIDYWTDAAWDQLLKGAGY